MTREIAFDVEGYPPAKNVALSIFGEKHPHRPRVVLLLRAAKSAGQQVNFDPFVSQPVGLEMVLRASPDDRTLGDGPKRAVEPQLGDGTETPTGPD